LIRIVLRNEEEGMLASRGIVMISEYGAKFRIILKISYDIEWQLMKSTRIIMCMFIEGDWKRVWETIRTDIPPSGIRVETFICGYYKCKH